MSNVLPIVLWYGGLLGVAVAALLALWGLALYAIKRSTDLFTAGMLTASLVLAVASSWAVSHAMSLNQDNQLRKVHEPLVRLVAGSVFARGALEDLRAAAEPSPDLTALQAKYDAHEASIESLLEAEWQYHRGGPWDERGLLYKTTWDLNEVRVHHARWEKRAEALECPATSALPALSDASALLQDRLQMQRTLAHAVGDQFEGYDLIEEESQPVSDATTMKMLAGVLGILALLGAAAVVFVVLNRSLHIVDALVVVAVLVLASLAAWLSLGAGAEQERLRADLFARAATVYRETVDLNESLKTVMPAPRGGVLQPRDSSDRLITDYAGYLNSVNGLTQLVRIWDRAVLTGTLDTGLISTERIQTHDDLLNGVRSRLLALYRQYVQLDRRIADMRCRSEWFERNDGRTREDELVALP
jgi:hypothetical protein